MELVQVVQMQFIIMSFLLLTNSRAAVSVSASSAVSGLMMVSQQRRRKQLSCWTVACKSLKQRRSSSSSSLLLSSHPKMRLLSFTTPTPTSTMKYDYVSFDTALFSRAKRREQTRTRLLFSTESPSPSPSSGDIDDDTNNNDNNKKGIGAGTTTALIFDTETTGMVQFSRPSIDIVQPDLVQLGFILVDITTATATCNNWTVRSKGSFLVQLRSPDVEIEEGAQKVHGISKEDCIKFGIEYELALNVFENVFNKADIIVAHNIKFDKIVMETAFHRRDDNDNGITTSTKIGSSSYSSFSDLLSSKRLICTMIESIDLCKIPSKFKKSSKVSSYKWPSLLEAYNFVSNETKKELDGGGHDAMVDAEACLIVFKYLVDNGHVTTTTTKLDTTMSTTPKFSSSTAATTETASSNLDTTATTMKTRIMESHHHPSMTTLTTAESTNIIDGGDGGGDVVEEKQKEFPNTIGSINDYDDDYVKDLSSIAIEKGETETIELPPDKPSSYSIISGDTRIQKDQQQPSSSRSSSNNSNSKSNKKENNGFTVRGNTYRHKETIKQLGGRWDGQSKEWIFFDLDNNTSMKALSELESYQDLEIYPFDNNSNSSNNNNSSNHDNNNSANSSNRA